MDKYIILKYINDVLQADNETKHLNAYDFDVDKLMEVFDDEIENQIYEKLGDK